MSESKKQKRERRTKDAINKMQEWERQTELRTDTELPGHWEQIDLECPHCSQSDYVYIFADDKTLYCLECSEEFDIADAINNSTEFDIEELLEDADIKQDMEQMSLDEMISDDPVLVKQMADSILAANDANKGKKKKKQKSKATYVSNYGTPVNTSGVTGATSTGFNYKNCFHRPQHIIAGEGWGVWAGRKDDCRTSAKHFDVIMNLTYTSIKEQHRIGIPELSKWNDWSCPYQELQMDWPDYCPVDLPKQFWVDLLHHLETSKKRMLVFCLGGHGRTGTAIAVMMCLSLGYKPEDAIAWVRKNYCSHAIESKAQENYIYEMAKTEPASATVSTAPAIGTGASN